jgi:hypothetical protein
VFIPQCMFVDEIKIETDTKFCYKDIPVIITLSSNQTSMGFLTRKLIIRETSYFIFSKLLGIYSRSNLQ